MNRTGMKWYWHLLTMALGLTVLIVWIGFSGPEKIITAMKNTNGWFVAGAVGIYAVTWVFRTLRFKSFTKEFSLSLSAGLLFQIQIAGFALNNLMPAKMGDFATIAMLKMRGARLGQAAAIVLQSRMLDIICLLFMVLPGIFHPAGTAMVAKLVFSLVGLSVVVLMVLVFLMLDLHHALVNYLRKRFVRNAHGKTAAWINHLESLLDALKTLLRHPRILTVSLFLSVGGWCFESAASACILYAVGWRGPIVQVMFTLALANLVKTIPLTPGGVGIYESIWAGMLVAFGLPVEVALVSGMLDHFLKKAFNLSIGLPMAVRLTRDIRHMKGNQ